MEARGFDKVMVPTIVAISIAVPVLVGALIFLPERQIIETQLGTFPFFHAVLNFTTTLLLITGFWFMKKGQYRNHRNTDSPEKIKNTPALPAGLFPSGCTSPSPEFSYICSWPRIIN